MIEILAAIEAAEGAEVLEGAEALGEASEVAENADGIEKTSGALPEDFNVESGHVPTHEAIKLPEDFNLEHKTVVMDESINLPEDFNISSSEDVLVQEDVDGHMQTMDKPFEGEFASLSEGLDSSESVDTLSQGETETGNETDEFSKPRDLTPEEREKIAEDLGWTDKQLDKCKIDDEGKIYYNTDNSDYEGQTINDVKYVRKEIEIDGYTIEGVFPEFDSKFDFQLEEEDFKKSSVAQFKRCNDALKEAISENPDLAKEFDQDQLNDIENGKTPRGYTWHHNEEPGKMQLVKTEDHDRRVGGCAHTGGKALWG